MPGYEEDFFDDWEEPAFAPDYFLEMEYEDRFFYDDDPEVVSIEMFADSEEASYLMDWDVDE